MKPPEMVQVEMVPAEEAVEALIDHLVSPFLPRRGISRGNPTTQQQEIVAKQMYKVVLLYNYYHRKQFPKLKVLDLKSFCKVACISKPPLLKYMNSIFKSDVSSGDLDEPLSITEKMILDACNVSSALEASKDSPNMEGWPVSKVSVFLVDPSRKYCLLKSINGSQPNLSLVEKEFEMPFYNGVYLHEINTSKNASGSFENKFKVIDDFLREVAFSAVEKEMGIGRTNLNVLECHISYSLTRIKSTNQLYIMSCAEPFGHQIPIKFVIQSLQGPIVKIKSAPEVTEVIGYYGLLPYTEVLSDWFSRTKQNWDTKMSKKRSEVDDSSINHNQKPLDSNMETNLDIVTPQNLFNAAKKGSNQIGADTTMISMHNSNIYDPLCLSPKVDMMSVLQMLKKNRDELCQQQRLLEDHIAHCEMNIQNLSSREEISSLKVESVLKTCELLCSNELKNSAKLFTEAHCQPQTIKRMKLCEAVLCIKSPSRELDDVFCTNNWILPKYCVLPSTDDGKFQAHLSVRGMDFEFDCIGDLKSSPPEARESAAAHMLSKLRGMAAEAVSLNK